MALQTQSNSAQQRIKEGRRALGIAYGLQLMRATSVMLASARSVTGLNKTFDGDMRMVRVANERLREWAKKEGIR